MRSYFFLTVLYFTVCLNTRAQSVKYYKACAEARNFYANKGDTIIFRCDSIRLLNPSAYHILEDSYDRLYRTSGELVNKTDSAGLIYRNLYEEKSREYNALKISYEQFRSNTQNHILATDTNVLAIKNNAINAKIQLQQADSCIAAGIADIRAFERNKWMVTIKAGAVGFLAATLILLPAIIF